MARRGVHEIVPGALWISGVPTPEIIDEFRIDVVISVCKKIIPDAVKCKLRAWFHHPIPDGLEVHDRTIILAAALAQEHITAGRRVLINCLAGRTRSATVAAVVLAEMHNLGGDAVLAEIRRIRPHAIANPQLERWLVAYCRRRRYQKMIALETRTALQIMERQS